MPNVLNPEPESITLNAELEIPTLEPATELEQPPFESTSNSETAEIAAADDEMAVLDADALTEPVAQAPPQAEPAPAKAKKVKAHAPPPAKPARVSLIVPKGK